MYRTRASASLFALFLVGVANLNASTPASTPMNEYEKKLRQAAKANRSFQLPNAQILNESFSAMLGMDYFLEKTGLIDKLANRHLYETGIYLTLDLAFYDYGQYVKNNMPPSMVESALIHEEMKPLLIDAIIRVSKEVKSEL